MTLPHNTAFHQCCLSCKCFNNTFFFILKWVWTNIIWSEFHHDWSRSMAIRFKTNARNTSSIKVLIYMCQVIFECVTQYEVKGTDKHLLTKCELWPYILWYQITLARDTPSHQGQHQVILKYVHLFWSYTFQLTFSVDCLLWKGLSASSLFMLNDISISV